MRERWVGWSVVGLLVAASMLMIDPVRVGLSMYTPFAHLIAIRGWLALGAVLGAGVALWCALLVRHRGEDRPTRLSAACVVLAVAAAAQGGVLLARGVTAPDALPAGKQPGDIDVLAFNTFDAISGEQAVSGLIAQHDPDIVMLSEIRQSSASRIAGDDFTMFFGPGQPGGSTPTALLLSPSLGEYTRIDGPDILYGMVGAAPIDGTGPVVYAVHVASPAGERMQIWRDELDLVTGICDRTEGIIMGGDFNATVDHAPLRDTTCVNGSVGVGGVGTWPASLPGVLGTPIDHVLADPTHFTPVASAVLSLPQADHRAMLVRLRST